MSLLTCGLLGHERRLSQRSQVIELQLPSQPEGLAQLLS